MKNYYDILGVNSSAGPDEIKRAYRKLASQHHPDKGGDVKKFQEIEQAYRTLSDPEKRQMYDNPRPDFSQFGFQSGPGGFDFDSIFDLFGTRFHNQQRRPNYARMSLWITLADVAQGGRRTVSVSGQHGTQTVEIDIPIGINDGDNIQYQGLAPGGGDLLVTYRVNPHPFWQRQGAHLIGEKNLSIWDLILGTELPVEDVHGNQILVTVPAKTQPGMVMRIRGRGLPTRNGNLGDLLVQIKTYIPDQISPEIIQAIEQNHSKNS